MKAPDQLLAVIDANSSGVSGDKYLGALVNMGGRVESLRKVARVVAENLPGTSRVEVEARRVERGGSGGHLVTVKSEETDDKVFADPASLHPSSLNFHSACSRQVF